MEKYVWCATTHHGCTERMSEHSTEIETSEGEKRYAAIETGAGETMIYDRENPDAWVQSTYTVEIGG